MSPRQVNILLAVVAMLLLPPLVARNAPNLFNDFRALILATAFCTAIAAISLNLLMGYAGQISLGHAALIGIGAFTSALVTTRGPELPMLAGIIAAGAVTGAFAFVLGLPALRLRGLYLAIVTIAFGLAAEQSLLRLKPITRGSAGLDLTRPLWGDLQIRLNGDYLVAVLLVFLFIVLVDRNVVRTKLGRAFHAIREDEQVAQSFGIDVSRYKLTAFVLSGVIAGISGALLAHLTQHVSFESFGYDVSLALVVIVVVGGLGSRSAVITAALFFTLLPRLWEFRALKFLSGIDPLIGAGLLIMTMALNPAGLAGAMREAREKREERKARAETDEEVIEVPKLPSLPKPEGLPERPGLSPGAPVLEATGISVRFGGLHALDDVSLQVPQGKIVGLIGPNGAGKTTFFNAASGFVRHSGRFVFMGREIQDLPPHERAQLGLGRTFQLIGLAKNLPLLENFLLSQHGVANYGLVQSLAHSPRATAVEMELRERSMEAIRALGFEKFTDLPVRTLSHGQQRIVELGCALVTAPDLLLLDEPSAGMAPSPAIPKSSRRTSARPLRPRRCLYELERADSAASRGPPRWILLEHRSARRLVPSSPRRDRGDSRTERSREERNYEGGRRNRSIEGRPAHP
jgi:branched-chain amino acid transport system permease protein